MRAPLPHQKQIVELTREKERYALYMAPGTGKTFTSLYTWYNYSQKKNLIVVTLPSLVKQWEREAKLMGFEDTHIRTLDLGTKKSNQVLLEDLETYDKGIYIVSYSSAKSILGLMMLKPSETGVVFDESHKTKNRGSQQSKFCVKLAKRYAWIRLLTGTPMSIGWEDYFVPLKLLDENDSRTKTIGSFKDNFMIIETKSNFSNRSTYEKVTGYKNLEILKEIINKTSIFVNEETAGIELPEQIEKTYFIEQDKEFKKAMKEKVFGTWMIKNSGSKMMAHRTGLSGFLYGEDKYGKRVVEKFSKQPKKTIFKDLLEGIDGQIIVFFNFEQEREDIKEICSSLDRSVSEIKGDDVDVSGDVIIAHYVSGSTGHNLQQVNKIIYYSPTITGSDFIQSKKRIHRIGQEKTCYYYYLITKGSIEETIFEKIKMNEDYTEEMFEYDEQDL